MTSENQQEASSVAEEAGPSRSSRVDHVSAAAQVDCLPPWRSPWFAQNLGDTVVRRIPLAGVDPALGVRCCLAVIRRRADRQAGRQLRRRGLFDSGDPVRSHGEIPLDRSAVWIGCDSPISQGNGARRVRPVVCPSAAYFLRLRLEAANAMECPLADLGRAAGAVALLDAWCHCGRKAGSSAALRNLAVRSQP